jgi:hypothetical protein
MGIHVPPKLIGDDYYCYPDADAAEGVYFNSIRPFAYPWRS